MARDFTATEAVYNNSSAPVTDYPVTMICWYRVTQSTSNYMFCIGDYNANVRWGLNLYLTTTLYGYNPSGQYTNAAGGALNAWQMGSMRNSTTDSPYFSVQINAGTASTTTCSGTPSGIDYTAVGGLRWSNAWNYGVTGAVAHCAVWNSWLTDEEITALYSGGQGLDPRCIQPENLKGYWPLDDDDGDVDYWGQTDLASTYGSPTYSSYHPPMRMSSGIWVPYQMDSGAAPTFAGRSHIIGGGVG